MYKFRNIALLLAVFTSFANAQEINKLDAQGKKNGLWKGVYDESKRPRYEGTFDHGAESGIFKYFDDTKSGIVIATREFSQNGTVAYTILYDRKGFIVSEGKTVNRQNEGEFKYYQEESKDIMTIENYKNGKLNGVRKVFYPNHNVAEEATYVDGVKNGPYKSYTEKGVAMEESNYKNGKYEGIAIFRDTDGNIVSKGPYVDGAQKGKWQFFENGKLKKEQVLPVVKNLAKPKKKQL